MKNNNTMNIWVTRIIESNFPFRIRNPLLASVLKFGLLPNLLMALFLLTRLRYLTSGLLLAYTLALIWINIGPYLIWYYDKRLLTNFFSTSSHLTKDEENLNKLETKYRRWFRTGFWMASIPWSALMAYIYLDSMKILTEKGGLFGVSDYLYWLIFGGVLWMALLTGIGFWGVLVTSLVIRELSHSSLCIDPLHPDKLGGLSSTGHYAIGTTLLFSSGSLFLPAAFQLFSGNKEASQHVIIGVSIFSSFILLSFLYPTISVHQQAKSVRDAVLGQLREKYVGITNSLALGESNGINAIVSHLELLRIRNEYQDYRAVKLYPFETKIFAKLISSVVLPFAFLLIQLYWGK